MSKYTTELRWIVQQKLNDLNLDNTEDNWAQVYPALGLADYPIFDETHRSVLNNKIIRAYYMREIGQETVGQFRWMMRRTMFEIMPYYNQLYESEKLIVEPLLTKDMDYTEKWTRDEKTDRSVDSTGNSTGSSNTDGREVFQDTPMNGLDTGAIEAMDYATNVTFDANSTDTKSDSSTHSDNSYTGEFEGTKGHNEKGFDQSQAELLLTYRKTFLNIDLEIVERLNELFLGLW